MAKKTESPERKEKPQSDPARLNGVAVTITFVLIDAAVLGAILMDANGGAGWIILVYTGVLILLGLGHAIALPLRLRNRERARDRVPRRQSPDGLGRRRKWVSNATVTNANVVNTACGTTLAAIAEAARNGNVYVNVHSVAKPGGLIRGQLLPAEAN